MTSDSPALDVQVEDSGPCSKVLRIKVPADRVDHEIEETFRNVQKAVQFPGFRTGKAPRKLVEARLGERVMAEVLERLVQTAFDEAVDSRKLRTVGTPRLKEQPAIVRGADLAIAIDVDVRPEFELPKLEELTVKRPAVSVSDADVDLEIRRLRDERATVSDAGDEPLAERGIAHLRVRIEVDGATIVDAADVEWQHPSDVLGGLAVENLAAGLLGRKRGDEATFEQKLPDDFRDEAHRGKPARIVLAIESVQKVAVPEVDDAFAAEMDYDSLDEMRRELRKELERRLAAQLDRMLDEAVADALLASVPFDVPPSLVASESDRMLRRYEAQLRQQGAEEGTIPGLVEDARTHAETRVQRDLRLSFLLDKVAAERKVLVTENEVNAEIAAIAARYGKAVPEMEDYMERNRLVPALRAELRDRKTLREIRGVARIVDEAPEPKQEAQR